MRGTGRQVGEAEGSAYGLRVEADGGGVQVPCFACEALGPAGLRVPAVGVNRPLGSPMAAVDAANGAPTAPPFSVPVRLALSSTIKRVASQRMGRMAEGVIKRLTDKGFGFIDTGGGKDLFFHMSAVEGVRFEDLKQGQRVSFME